MTCISGIFFSVEALDVVGPRLSKECRERDLSVTDKAAAEIFVTRSLKVSHTKNIRYIMALSDLFQFVHIFSIPICCSFQGGNGNHHEMP